MHGTTKEWLALINFFLVAFTIKFAVGSEGFVNEVTINEKFVCPKAFKETVSVTSEIQCTHRCLQRKCKLLNYHTKQGSHDNCEIYTDDSQCVTVVNQDKWKAMNFQVRRWRSVVIDIAENKVWIQTSKCQFSLRAQFSCVFPTK